jgi:hypothetical protein
MSKLDVCERMTLLRCSKCIFYHIPKTGGVKDLNFVGRQENLMGDLIKALTLAGEDFDVEKIKETKPINIAAGNKKYGDQCNLSDETRERILKAEKWVIDKFYG